MKLFIENCPVAKRNKSEFAGFVEALGRVDVDQSFLVSAVKTNHRCAISVVQYLTGKRFSVRKHNNGYRVGRVA